MPPPGQEGVQVRRQDNCLRGARQGQQPEAGVIGKGGEGGQGHEDSSCHDSLWDSPARATLSCPGETVQASVTKVQPSLA